MPVPVGQGDGLAVVGRAKGLVLPGQRRIADHLFDDLLDDLFDDDGLFDDLLLDDLLLNNPRDFFLDLDNLLDHLGLAGRNEGPCDGHACSSQQTATA